MAVSPARNAAMRILLRVHKEDAYSAELLHSSLLDPLSAPDRALCTQIVMGVLRWQSSLDHAIEQAVGSEPKFRKLDVEVLTALRIGVYQLGYLERIPQRAAIHESVELTKKARKTSAAPLVNAVLRRIAQEIESLVPSPPTEDSPAALARAYAHPLWLAERWVERFGSERTRRICEYDQTIPAASLRLNSGDWQEVEQALARDGIHLGPGHLLRSARRVTSGNIHMAKLPAEGAASVQDEASQLVALLVGEGRRILDCCAAPGGKTSLIAAVNPDAEIVATELHPHRAQLLERLLRAKNVKVLTADATRLPPLAPFDRVLADVPCSGTGTLARNPEIKWKLQLSDLGDLQERQVSILRSALEHAAAGARVVYSTCSLESEECEEVVSRVMEESPSLKLLPCGALLQELRDQGELVWPDISSLCMGRFVRTLPGVHPCDGFFAAVLEKA